MSPIIAGKKLRAKRKRKKKSRYKRGTYNSKKAGLVKYRSGWELSYLIHLDSNPSVLSFTYEPFFIEYLSNKKTGTMRKYYPDVLVTLSSGEVQLVEIKPKRRLAQAKTKKKLEAARRHCEKNGTTFVVITETELAALGLIGFS